MTSTSDGDWAEISELFDSIIEVGAAARASALRRSTAAIDVKHHVEAMIAALEASPDFLDQPPVLHGAVTRPGSGWISQVGAAAKKINGDAALEDLDGLAEKDEAGSVADGITSACFLTSQDPCSEE